MKQLITVALPSTTLKEPRQILQILRMRQHCESNSVASIRKIGAWAAWLLLMTLATVNDSNAATDSAAQMTVQVSPWRSGRHHDLPQALRFTPLTQIDNSVEGAPNLSGRPFVLLFTETWCVNCVLLEIQLAQLEKELADRDLNVIALYGRESDPETAIRQRKSEHIVIAYDNDDEMRRMTRIGEYPHGFLFNAHHEPIAEFIGLPLAKIQPLINLVPKRKLTSKR